MTIDGQVEDFTGRISANVTSGSYEATLVLDGVAHPPVTVCTAPDASDTRGFSFLAYSCFAPFPSNGGSTPKARTVHCLNLLQQRSAGHGDAKRPGPAFALALGDQVYVDNGVQSFLPPKRALLSGWRSQLPRYPEGATATEVEGYFRELYDAYLRIPSYEASLRSIPHAMMWDDHDIRDGWGSQGDEAGWSAHLQAARAAFLAHQYARNPGTGGENSAEGNELHFQFEWGAATRFFVMDLRSQRQTTKRWGSVVSGKQLEDIKHWLSVDKAPHPPRLYVLATALPLTHAAENTSSITWSPWFRADDRRDNWWSDESRLQRDEILWLLREHFAGHRADRLLVLSGDVHFGEILSLTLEEGDERRVFGHEVISSGLAQSSFHAKYRKETQARSPLIWGLCSASAGSRLFAPHFAEIFVGQASNDQAPSVEVLFYPSADPDKKVLVNPLCRLHELVRKALPLPVGPIATGDKKGPPVEAVKLKSFDHFMLHGRNPASWSDDASEWSVGGACWDPEVCSTNADTSSNGSAS